MLVLKLDNLTAHGGELQQESRSCTPADTAPTRCKVANNQIFTRFIKMSSLPAAPGGTPHPRRSEQSLAAWTSLTEPRGVLSETWRLF